ALSSCADTSCGKYEPIELNTSDPWLNADAKAVVFPSAPAGNEYPKIEININKRTNKAVVFLLFLGN
ncbi:MAG: hypothetical protein H6Q64_1620, partial [Firmicutes bacterium]|nr:hypothetical protein [Bacillota bacterium]